MPDAKTQQELQDLLQHHGVSATSPRLKIASRLLCAPRHISAEQLIGELRDCGQQVSKATVYNTLGLFSKVGLVREVIADSDRKFYDSNTHPHQHLYDAQTATLTDINDSDIEIRVLPVLPAHMEIEAVDIVIRVRQRHSDLSDS